MTKTKKAAPVAQLPTVKKTPNRIKMQGATFLHYAKCTPGNHYPKEYTILPNGVQYFKMKKEAVDTPDVITEEEVATYDLEDFTYEMPSAAELKAIEKMDMLIDEDGKLQTVAPEDKPKIKYTPSGKKTDALFLNPKTGNYVVYVRWIQIKAKHPGFWDEK